ncbi:MAG: hypothetical protein ACREH3_18875, partial [Geminicoccales bacterium]
CRPEWRQWMRQPARAARRTALPRRCSIQGQVPGHGGFAGLSQMGRTQHHHRGDVPAPRQAHQRRRAHQRLF